MTMNHYKFTDLEHDDESNLEHTQFRQLSSVQGRWLSPDPYMGSMDLTNPQSLNRYAYVNNNPLGFVDPQGLVCSAAVGDRYDTPCNPANSGGGGGSGSFGGWSDLDLLAAASTPTALLGYVQVNEAGQIIDIGVYPYYGNSAMLSLLGFSGFYNGGLSSKQLPKGEPPQFTFPFLNGLNQAQTQLQQDQCSAFYGGDGSSTLNALQFRFVDLGSGVGGDTPSGGGLVFLNGSSTGPYMRPPSTFYGASGTSEVRAFIILHELAHVLKTQTGFFDQDPSDSPNGPARQTINNLRLNYNCFGGKRY